MNSGSGAVLPALLALGLAGLLAACTDPWKPATGPVRSLLDTPLASIRAEPDRYRGMVFEDRFKFYRIYHDRETADPAKREQVILGKTHFTARPISQYVHVIRIRITPEQEAWFRQQGIHRQDTIRARIRFAEIAPGGALAFELLEVLQP